MTDPTSSAHLDATRDDRLESYREFLRIPSISALPEHAADVRRAAEWLAGAPARGRPRARRGVARPAAIRSSTATGSTPPGAPTVLVYGHYDVQPVDPLDLWKSPPFEPVVATAGSLGRGAADDKGQIHAHLMAAEALLATAAARFPVNLRFVFEGEEENGVGEPRPRGWRRTASASRRMSRSSATRLLRGQPAGDHRRPARAACTPRSTSPGRPSTCTRAGTAAPSRTRPTRWPRSSRRSRGRTAGSGSRASTTTSSTLTDEERAAMAALPFDEDGYRRETGVAGARRRGRATRRSSAEAIRPTLDVNGIWGGFQGDGSKTIIPAHAHAKVSCRLVADQDPARHLRASSATSSRTIAPPGVTVTVTGPRRRPPDADADRPSGRRRRPPGPSRRSSGRRPSTSARAARSRSRPSFESILGLPVVLLGFAQPHDNAHAPNEWMDLDNYEGAIRAIVRDVRRDRRAAR